MTIDNTLSQLYRMANTLASGASKTGMTTSQLNRLAAITLALSQTLTNHVDRLSVNKNKSSVSYRLPMGLRDGSGRHRAKVATQRKRQEIEGRRKIQFKEDM